MFEIYFSDLTPEAQVRFLAACGLSSASEGNYDVLPITAISTLEMDRESAETSENGVCNEESTEASEIVEREEALA